VVCCLSQIYLETRGDPSLAISGYDQKNLALKFVVTVSSFQPRVGIENSTASNPEQSGNGAQTRGRLRIV
jgi:hypothetical protein